MKRLIWVGGMSNTVGLLLKRCLLIFIIARYISIIILGGSLIQEYKIMFLRIVFWSLVKYRLLLAVIIR